MVYVSGPDAYADWAPVYPPYAHNALMEVEEAAVLALLPDVSGCRALDAGCGTGRYIRLLSAVGADVVGIDRSPAMLMRARFFGASVMQADMAALPVRAQTIDVLVSGLAVMDVPNLEPVMAEWARALRPGGIVVYSALHPIGRELGWKRTFDGVSGTHTLPAYWHTRTDHELACRQAGLAIDRFEEPTLTCGGERAAVVVRARRAG